MLISWGHTTLRQGQNRFKRRLLLKFHQIPFVIGEIGKNGTKWSEIYLHFNILQ